ncbi:MAG: M23 family metallopeptidase [Polyangiaceae bacterium]|nr:M23 family metallopeptidase [Polyangiaceae bacterium]
MCQVDYQYNQFTINDRHAEAGTWQSSRAVDMTLSPAISDWDGSFKAYARIPEKVGETTMPDGSTVAFYQSTFPYYGELGSSDFFAVHRDDRFSLFAFESTDEDLARLQLLRHVGALEMSALRYPRVEGSNFVTGESFTYTCSVPPIVRDTVAMCQDIDKPVDSFYLLPYQGSHYTVQGNFGLISHDGDYAYDFEGALSAVADPVLAARRGVVIDVQEEYSESCPVEQTCNNNLVYIRHQDGSVARYLHFATDQVAVEVGDIVERGTLLGTMGMVGVAAMDHLHFEVHEGAHDVLALFDDVDDPCVEPKGPADNRKSTLTSGETTTLQYKLHPEKGMPAKR